MTIDFGKVEKYIEDRGFGFVSHTFTKVPSEEVYFHIKVVKRTHLELAQTLDSTTDKEVYFWYEYRPSSKGYEVSAILDLKQLRQKHADLIKPFINTIKTSWMNVGQPLPESLRKVTSELLTLDAASQLMASRETLEAEHRRHQEELQRGKAARRKERVKNRAAQARAEAARRQERVKNRATQVSVEEEEFHQLVIEMSTLRFTQSREVSAYIVRHNLGHKYKHISGILQMELDGDVWDFNGGFPPSIYARLCAELGLRNKGSRAKPGEFTPYKNIIDN